MKKVTLKIIIEAYVSDDVTLEELDNYATEGLSFDENPFGVEKPIKIEIEDRLVESYYTESTAKKV